MIKSDEQYLRDSGDFFYFFFFFSTLINVSYSVILWNTSRYKFYNGIIARYEILSFITGRSVSFTFRADVFSSSDEGMSMAIKIPSPIGATAGAVDETMARPGRCCQPGSGVNGGRDRTSRLQILPRRVRSPPLCVCVRVYVDVSRGISSNMYSRKSSHDVHETARPSRRGRRSTYSMSANSIYLSISHTSTRCGNTSGLVRKIVAVFEN